MRAAFAISLSFARALLGPRAGAACAARLSARGGP
jgi:hypothetical protein